VRASLFVRVGSAPAFVKRAVTMGGELREAAR